ncbi:hypothetical protein P171DRAFT_257082 [Karstenula rhodostoma CBS 690.94]|uniref:Uncharacterized protein n=1 Tax=Karstenula rhodostoma CBS 690.94 TaxID=1392251 RepID=A0A9P4PN39_9PLEO|nr:hypothetical protein P171DRAFT_257082 [Karstenula rhodostoma CBS 690.94]
MGKGRVRIPPSFCFCSLRYFAATSSAALWRMPKEVAGCLPAMYHLFWPLASLSRLSYLFLLVQDEIIPHSNLWQFLFVLQISALYWTPQRVLPRPEFEQQPRPKQAIYFLAIFLFRGTTPTMCSFRTATTTHRRLMSSEGCFLPSYAPLNLTAILRQLCNLQDVRNTNLRMLHHPPLYIRLLGQQDLHPGRVPAD